MKWWNRRQPEDLVGWQVEELAARDAAERALVTPQGMEAGTSWADAWRSRVSAAGMVPLTVESNGWCAPSEVIYGMLDLPEVHVQRGGLRYAERQRAASAGVLVIPEDVTFPRG